MVNSPPLFFELAQMKDDIENPIIPEGSDLEKTVVAEEGLAEGNEEECNCEHCQAVAEAKETISTFKQRVELELEMTGTNDFFKCMPGILAMANESDINDVKIEEEEELIEEFAEELEELVANFNKKYQGEMRENILSRVKEEGTPLNKMLKQWILSEKISNFVDESRDEIDKFEEAFEGMKLTGVVKKRIQQALCNIRKLEEYSFPKEEIIGTVVYQAYLNRAENEAARKKGLFSRSKDITVEGTAVDLLDRNYAYSTAKDSQLNNLQFLLDELSRMDKGLSSISYPGLDKKKEAAKKLRELLLGEVGIKDQDTKDVPAQKLDEFIEANGLNPDFKKIVEEVLRPILGRRGMVDDVKFITSTSPNGNAGDYWEGEIRIFNTEECENAKCDKQACIDCKTGEYTTTLAHEAGHALKPEGRLPLRESVIFNAYINLSRDEFSGPISQYSKEAKEHYAKKMGGIFNLMKTGISQESIEGVLGNDAQVERLKDSEIEEEWAEICGFLLVNPDLALKRCPEKMLILVEVLSHYNIDNDQITDGIQDILFVEEEDEDQ